MMLGSKSVAIKNAENELTIINRKVSFILARILSTALGSAILPALTLTINTANNIHLILQSIFNEKQHVPEFLECDDNSSVSLAIPNMSFVRLRVLVK